MIKIDSVKISAKNVFDVKSYICDKYKIKECDIKTFKIIKKSLDARDKQDILYIYTCSLSLNENKEKSLVNKYKNISFYDEIKYEIPKANNSNSKVIIVGFGPAGIFASYLLAIRGFKPIVIERGSSIDDRTKEVNDFWNNNKLLNSESNVQFGEGGAGTFSDGKLNTGVKDKEGRIEYILETFVKYGAKENILYDSKPHVGTDILAKVIKEMREEILRLGGQILFNTRFDSIECNKDRISSVNCTNLKNKETINIPCDNLILALGHSSRDANRYLKNLLKMEQKPFAMGFRVIHKQDLINISQYGKNYLDIYESLPECSYKLTYQTKENRGVYSFCMCPGGYVVNASSNEGKTCVNGMSYNDRASGYANSAIIVQIKPEDLDSDDVLAGMEFQEQVEEKAYKAGNGKIPVCRLNDLDENLVEYKGSSIETKDALKGEYINANLNNIFPDYINASFLEGMKYFDNKIRNFATSNPLIAGVEARTSSPVKIIRDDNFQANIKGIFPCGEGAGYAGGIISAAIDGMKVAEYIIKEQK